MSQIIKIKRGSKSSLPILSEGEFGFATDTSELYLGNGDGNQKIVSYEDIVTSISDPGSDTVVPSEQAVKEAIKTYASSHTKWLSGEVEENTASIDELQTDVDWLSGEVSENTTSINELQTDVDWLSGEVVQSIN